MQFMTNLMIVMPAPRLTQIFDSAAQRCQTETRALSEALQAHFNDNLHKILPRWHPEEWHSGAPFNCYNYALDRKDVPTAAPGNFSGQIFRRSGCGMDKWHEDVHNGALRDGLIYLGEDFCAATLEENVSPVALFLRPDPYVDFHWEALRADPADQQDLLCWSALAGCQGRVIKWPDAAAMFNTAALYEYRYFAGYYGVPRQESNTPTSRKDTASLGPSNAA